MWAVREYPELSGGTHGRWLWCELEVNGGCINLALKWQLTAAEKVRVLKFDSNKVIGSQRSEHPKSAHWVGSWERMRDWALLYDQFCSEIQRLHMFFNIKVIIWINFCCCHYIPSVFTDTDTQILISETPNKAPANSLTTAVHQFIGCFKLCLSIETVLLLNAFLSGDNSHWNWHSFKLNWWTDSKKVGFLSFYR